MARQYLSTFKLFKDTPLTDLNNTIHFSSNSSRDNFFLENSPYITIDFSSKFNHVRDRLRVSVPYSYADLTGVNYATFKSDSESQRYYAFVVGINYVNDGVSTIDLMIDTMMTFTQGHVLETLQNQHIIREHLPNDEYEAYLPRLRTNSDILTSTTKKYVRNDSEIWSDFYVIFLCSSDLSSDFGTLDKPNLVTSKGNTYDNVTSPVNIYLITYDYFNDLMDILQDYPWISQNISQILLIPFEMIDESDLVKVTMHDNDFAYLTRFKNGAHSKNQDIPNLDKSTSELCSILGIDPENDLHLLRSGYTTIEAYSWDGQAMLLEAEQLDRETGLQFHVFTSFGYFNQIAIYPQMYQADSDENVDDVPRGTFLNNAIIYNNFSELPVLIDNYKLSLANSANKRKLAESRQLTGRVSSITDKNSSLQDRFANAFSVGSMLANPATAVSKLNDEYEFYRDQKAEFADLQLSSPTITSQTNGTTFQMANDLFGLTVKYSAPTKNEWDKIRKYYNSFGFELNEDNHTLHDVESMSIANYVQTKGNIDIPEMDITLVEQLRVVLENGVRLWHNNNTGNPFSQNLLENVRVK